MHAGHIRVQKTNGSLLVAPDRQLCAGLQAIFAHAQTIHRLGKELHAFARGKIARSQERRRRQKDGLIHIGIIPAKEHVFVWHKHQMVVVHIERNLHILHGKNDVIISRAGKAAMDDRLARNRGNSENRHIQPPETYDVVNR